MNLDNLKRAAGEKAAEFVEPKMIIGLGTGSTVAYFIERLIQRSRDGLQIQVVASSNDSAIKAKRGGLTVLDLNEVPHIDLTVDGADEIDPQKRMIKGGGGAHVREKILAASSKEMVVIVDETKQVPLLGIAKLPIEIVRFGAEQTKRKLEEVGYVGEWRMGAQNTPFISDNGNPIFDLSFPHPLRHPEKEEEKLVHIPGVIATGFFFGLAGRVVVGHANGKTTIF